MLWLWDNFKVLPIFKITILKDNFKVQDILYKWSYDSNRFKLDLINIGFGLCIYK